MTTGDLARILRYLNNRRPFMRFEIVFNSGDRVELRHPETVQQRDDMFSHSAPDRSHRIFSAAGVSDIHVPPALNRPATGD
jgi:hypothetical protein